MAFVKAKIVVQERAVKMVYALETIVVSEKVVNLVAFVVVVVRGAEVKGQTSVRSVKIEHG